MNILFYSAFGADKNSGGVQHVTLRLAEALKNRYNYKCFISQKIGIKTYDSAIFDDVIEINRNTRPDEIRSFVIANKIKFIVVQSVDWVVQLYHEATMDLGYCKIIFCYHSQPGIEYHTTTFETYLLRVKYSCGVQRIKNILHCILFPLEKYRRYKEVYQRFKIANASSDRILLLSEKCIPDYMQYVDKHLPVKVSAINNPVSFDIQNSGVNMKKKEKRVLIVARFEEETKKISLALRIWALIENNPHLNDWVLDIVGDGPDRGMYEQIKVDLKLSRVHFHGFNKPEPFYERSSVFMMTSLCEGWPLTLNEAMQYGCVPFVFDSFSSHSDIVVNDDSGYIIKYHDLRSYADKLGLIMLDDSLRYKVARKAEQHIQLFSIEKISEIWNNYLNSI